MAEILNNALFWYVYACIYGLSVCTSFYVRYHSLPCVHIRLVAVNNTLWCRYGHGKPEESDEAFDARWLSYFNRPDLDEWDLKKGVNDLYGHDLVPEPKIVVAMLQAARRLNNIALAVRILEAVKSKAAGDKEVYGYILTEIKSTLEELGIRTPEELGLA